MSSISSIAEIDELYENVRANSGSPTLQGKLNKLWDLYELNVLAFLFFLVVVVYIIINKSINYLVLSGLDIQDLKEYSKSPSLNGKCDINYHWN